MLQKPLGVCERGIRPTNEKYSARVNEYVRVDLGWFEEMVTKLERGCFLPTFCGTKAELKQQSNSVHGFTKDQSRAACCSSISCGSFVNANHTGGAYLPNDVLSIVSCRQGLESPIMWVLWVLETLAMRGQVLHYTWR